MSNRSKIRSAYAGYDEIESIVISANDKFLDGLHKQNTVMLRHRKSDSVGWMAGRKQVKDADDGLVIDKVCILSFPLNDSRTSQKLRDFYHDQEELMVDLAAIEREESREVELSSPAREMVIRAETSSILKTMSEADYQLMKENNWKFLRSIFPEMDQPEIQ